MKCTHPRFLTGRCTTVRLVSSLCTHQAEREGTHQKLPRAPRQSSLPPRLQAPSLPCSHRLRWGERAGAGLQPTAATRRRSHANLVLKETSGHRGFADAWAQLFVPLASFPLPPAGDGRERADRLRAEMAAVVRGARAGRGGHGRDQGRRRGRAEEQEAVPQVQDRVTPLHHQWSLWCDGNRNTIKLVDSDELKAYRILEQSANIDRLELDSFAIPDGLLVQPAHIVRMLYDLVDYYNNMMMIRRKYLVKKLDGCWSKEMKQMLKTHDKYLDRVNEKLDAIADAGGNCPPRPKVFDAHPKLCK